MTQMGRCSKAFVRVFVCSGVVVTSKVGNSFPFHKTFPIFFFEEWCWGEIYFLSPFFLRLEATLLLVADCHPEEVNFSREVCVVDREVLRKCAQGDECGLTDRGDSFS